jgi:hypothetical protein
MKIRKDLENKVISQKFVEHPNVSGLRKARPKMNIIEPLVLRQSYFSNYLALFWWLSLPCPYILS